MSVNAIENALNAHLADAGLGLPIAWQGLRYEPAADQAYLRATFLPAQVSDDGQEIGLTAPVRQNGSYVITALYPITAGPGPLRAMAALIEARFAWRQDLIASAGDDTFRIRITSCSREVMITEDGRNSLPVMVRWLTKRP